MNEDSYFRYTAESSPESKARMDKMTECNAYLSNSSIAEVSQMVFVALIGPAVAFAGLTFSYIFFGIPLFFLPLFFWFIVYFQYKGARALFHLLYSYPRLVKSVEVGERVSITPYFGHAKIVSLYGLQPLERTPLVNAIFNTNGSLNNCCFIKTDQGSFLLIDNFLDREQLIEDLVERVQVDPSSEQTAPSVGPRRSLFRCFKREAEFYASFFFFIFAIWSSVKGFLTDDIPASALYAACFVAFSSISLITYFYRILDIEKAGRKGQFNGRR